MNNSEEPKEPKEPESAFERRIWKFLLIAVIPVSIMLFDSYYASQTLSKEYVALSIDILRKAEDSNVDKQLRDWAVTTFVITR